MTVQYRKIFVLYFARSLYSIIEDILPERCYKLTYTRLVPIFNAPRKYLSKIH